jgi:antitoxin component YwqK of YwqJK toxin-antitoxin module
MNWSPDTRQKRGVFRKAIRVGKKTGKMEKLFVIAVMLFAFTACGNAQKKETPAEVKMHELEDRGGLAHLPGDDQPFTGTAYAYYPDGTTLFLKSEFKDGKQNGLYEEFYKDGQLNYRYSFKEGKEDGEWSWYTEGGTMIKLETYKDGQLHGPWSSWYENGQQRVKGQFENGEEVGEWFAWDEEGNPMER